LGLANLAADAAHSQADAGQAEQAGTEQGDWLTRRR
jgi:hypothetical protein